ncbi:hypothetical protein A0J61_00972 [Choanephora cucurbitarum]|uniref:Yeast cell wall synthesis Kre9/Knh1-like N-terminal domain-containing protein n=1 Tax=Choanephora cucurbitarum TaxID=101091 RepID=A0A1C7NPC9_9FUNG|nr:hypothetical protein A0J61_00972 [Choanephora cucurbitarum]
MTLISVKAQFNTDEDCIVTNPISNTIVTAGEKMKIAWSNSHTDKFPTIYLVQSDGADKTPVIIAQDVATSDGHILVDLPNYLAPSGAYYMTLGEAPYHCVSGNIRIFASPTGTVRPPGGGGSSEGHYPKPEPTDAGLSLKSIPLSVLILLASLLLLSWA